MIEIIYFEIIFIKYGEKYQLNLFFVFVQSAVNSNNVYKINASLM